MGQLSLALLGTPEVLHSGQPVKFRTRKELALLIYLAVEGGLHSREKITTLFWPESDVVQGRTTLRRALANLRSVLHDMEESGASHLHIEREVLGLDLTSNVELDVHTLAAALALDAGGRGDERLQARNTTGAGTSAVGAVNRPLREVAGLYRGPFLEGFSLNDAPDFDNWLLLQRETCHRRMSLLLERLSASQLRDRAVADAIETAARWIAHDPLNESARMRLMEAHLAASHRNAALQAYEAYRTYLSSELDMRPSAEMEALAASIQSGVVRGREVEVGHATGGTTTRSRGQRGKAFSPQQSSAQQWEESTSGVLVGPLVGRVQEYARLIEAYRDVERGQMRAVILRGEAGMGKTRLASEFLGRAAEMGADVLQGRAFEAGGRLPYQPLVDAPRLRIQRDNAPDDLLSDPWLAELARLLPELRERYPDLPEPTGDENIARLRLFEAITRLLQALAGYAPVVLFLDDIHWIDVASLDLLHYAGRRWMEQGTPILLLLGQRLESAGAGSDLARSLESLQRDLQVTGLRLKPLTRDSTLELVRAICTSRVEAAGEWLFGETQGQPFYIMETLKALLDHGVLSTRRQVDGSWRIDYEGRADDLSNLHHFLPPGVREVIRSRLDQLTPPAFTLLAAGAVLGHHFTFERLCQVADLGENEGLPALDELLARRLLYEAGTESGDYLNAPTGTYFFTHDKIRDVVYTEAGEARRRIFHRRALDMLQRVAAPAAELVHHALAARQPVQAFSFSIAAGENAMQLFAVRDAIAHYERARQIAAQWQATPGESHAPTAEAMRMLYDQLGRAYEFINELEAARTIYQEMLAFAHKLDAPGMECIALNHLATVIIHESYDLDQAMLQLQQALDAGEKSNDTTALAETEWSLAQLYFYRFDVRATVEHGQRALTLARQLDWAELVARCLNVTAYGIKDSGQWEEYMPYAQEALDIYRRLGNRAMEVDCRCLLASVKIHTGQPAAALAIAEEARAIALEAENLWGQANTLYHMATAYMEMGKYGEALALAQQCMDIARTHDITTWTGNSQMLAGTVYRAILALDEARAAHLASMAVHETVQSYPLTRVASAEVCADCALSGLWEEAAAFARLAIEPDIPLFLLATRLHRCYETQALLRAGEVELAANYTRLVGESIGSNRRHRIPYLRSLASLARYQHRLDGAIAYLQEAAQLAREIGLPGELWPMLAELGDLYLEQGDTERAAQVFARAADIVYQLADSIGDDRRKEVFLSSPLVRRLPDQYRAGGNG